ncbi:MAG: aromatic ring-hydroxylating oxygenase subunit alpha [Acidimicrobiales bacterium]
MGRPPIDPEAIAASLRPHGESVMLPAAAYTSAEVLAWERRHVFAGSWTCVGRVEELAADGATYRAVEVGDVGVVVTTAGDGTVRALANVCRHRGHELLPVGGAAERRTIVCPYHGWTYRLDGELRSAPRITVDGDAYGLVVLPAQVWHGWVFVDGLGQAPPFDRYVGALADLVGPYHPERLRLGARHRYEVAANWKVIVENYHECYHCPLIHPELCRVSPPASGANWDLPGAWVGGAMELRPEAETMSLDGRSAGQFLPGVDHRSVLYIGLFPNLLISAHPDYVMTHRLAPLAPDRTAIECSWYVPDGVSDPAYAVDFWDVTNREDWAACESVQRGLRSPHFRPGPLAPAEDAVHQWVTLMARVYLDPAAALAAASAPASATPIASRPNSRQ